MSTFLLPTFFRLTTRSQQQFSSFLIHSIYVRRFILSSTTPSTTLSILRALPVILDNNLQNHHQYWRREVLKSNYPHQHRPNYNRYHHHNYHSLQGYRIPLLDNDNSFQNIKKKFFLIIQQQNNLTTNNKNNNIKKHPQVEPQTPEFIAERMIQALPIQLQPYAVLMRLTKPTGTWLLLWPCWWSIALATSAGHLPSLNMLALFAIGAILLRSSGCIINDLWDRGIDAKVERTQSRPIAAKQISPLDAALLVHGLNACGLLVILQFDINSIMLAFSSMALVLVYPTCKRFTNYPQAVLGMAFNWGALLGWSAVTGGTLNMAAVLPLYLGGICWTMIYDTIYAHQDKRDDIKLGLKSTAIYFGDRSREYMYGFTGLMATSLILAGINTSQCWPYYLSVVACGIKLARIIYKTDFNDVQHCARAFNQNIHIGWMFFIGIVASTLLMSNKEDMKKIVMDDVQQQQIEIEGDKNEEKKNILSDYSSNDNNNNLMMMIKSATAATTIQQHSSPL